MGKIILGCLCSLTITFSTVLLAQDNDKKLEQEISQIIQQIIKKNSSHKNISSNLITYISRILSPLLGPKAELGSFYQVIAPSSNNFQLKISTIGHVYPPEITRTSNTQSSNPRLGFFHYTINFGEDFPRLKSVNNQVMSIMTTLDQFATNHEIHYYGEVEVNLFDLEILTAIDLPTPQQISMERALTNQLKMLFRSDPYFHPQSNLDLQKYLITSHFQEKDYQKFTNFHRDYNFLQLSALSSISRENSGPLALVSSWNLETKSNFLEFMAAKENLHIAIISDRQQELFFFQNYFLNKQQKIEVYSKAEFRILQNDPGFMERKPPFNHRYLFWIEQAENFPWDEIPLLQIAKDDRILLSTSLPWSQQNNLLKQWKITHHNLIAPNLSIQEKQLILSTDNFGDIRKLISYQFFRHLVKGDLAIINKLQFSNTSEQLLGHAEQPAIAKQGSVARSTPNPFLQEIVASINEIFIANRDSSVMDRGIILVNSAEQAKALKKMLKDSVDSNIGKYAVYAYYQSLPPDMKLLLLENFGQESGNLLLKDQYLIVDLASVDDLSLIKNANFLINLTKKVDFSQTLSLFANILQITTGKTGVRVFDLVYGFEHFFENAIPGSLPVKEFNRKSRAVNMLSIRAYEASEDDFVINPPKQEIKPPKKIKKSSKKDSKVVMVPPQDIEINHLEMPPLRDDNIPIYLDRDKAEKLLEYLQHPGVGRSRSYSAWLRQIIKGVYRHELFENYFLNLLKSNRPLSELENNWLKEAIYCYFDQNHDRKYEYKSLLSSSIRPPGFSVDLAVKLLENLEDNETPLQDSGLKLIVIMVALDNFKLEQYSYLLPRFSKLIAQIDASKLTYYHRAIFLFFNKIVDSGKIDDSTLLEIFFNLQQNFRHFVFDQSGGRLGNGRDIFSILISRILKSQMIDQLSTEQISWLAQQGELSSSIVEILITQQRNLNKNTIVFLKEVRKNHFPFTQSLLQHFLQDLDFYHLYLCALLVSYDYSLTGFVKNILQVWQTNDNLSYRRFISKELMAQNLFDLLLQQKFELAYLRRVPFDDLVEIYKIFLWADQQKIKISTQIGFENLQLMHEYYLLRINPKYGSKDAKKLERWKVFHPLAAEWERTYDGYMQIGKGNNPPVHSLPLETNDKTPGNCVDHLINFGKLR